MKPTLPIVALVAAVLCLGAAQANAADVEPAPDPFDWYITLFGGVSSVEDFDVTYEVNGDLDDADGDVDGSGFVFGGAIGTHLTENIRVELEASYSESDMDSLDFGSGADLDAVDGDFEFLTVLANLWYDVPLSDDIKPYLGGGAGVAIVDGDIDYTNGQTAFDSTEVAFAFQVGAGMRWEVSRDFTLDVGYRFKGIDGPSFSGSDIGASKADADWMFSHSLIGGISLGF
jgi:opacity protein-like surface antigen